MFFDIKSVSPGERQLHDKKALNTLLCAYIRSMHEPRRLKTESFRFKGRKMLKVWLLCVFPLKPEAQRALTLEAVIFNCPDSVQLH